jgi:hypothetical protein
MPVSAAYAMPSCLTGHDSMIATNPDAALSLGGDHADDCAER